MPQLAFFVGKGGVGKTTVSAAYALWQARKHPRKKILLLSTDPAHSLGDVLQLSLSDAPTRVSGKLFAREIDASAELKRFLADNRQQILQVIERGSFFTADEVGPLLDATLPGMSEIAGLLALDDLLQSGEYDEIVVDTAPMGHTLRMFEMPSHFARLLDFLRTASSRDELLAARFANKRLPPDPFLEEWRAMVERLRLTLRGTDSRVVLVTTPEPFAVKESQRAADWLKSEGEADIAIDTIVINRTIRNPGRCGSCKARARHIPHAERALRQTYPEAKILKATDPGAPLMGASQLQAFGSHIFEERPLRVTINVPKLAEPIEFKSTEWPALRREMSFTVGKGGVGKTTISAALAFHSRKVDGVVVTVCSTDPAPSLDDVFNSDVGETPAPVLDDDGLRAAEIDALGEYQRWASEMRRRVDDSLTGVSQGLHLDLSFDRELLDALLDVVPPGVDEIFAILRIAEMIKPRERLIIDMAPTGHALDLLRTPDRLLSWTRMLLKTLAANRTLPLARDAAVEVATIQHKVRELAQLMRDPQRSAIEVVMLAEPMPDRETRRLLRSLKDLGSPAERIIVNRVMLRKIDGCKRCERARKWQMRTISRLAATTEVLIAPEVQDGVAGRSALERFTAKIWRLA